MANLLTRRLTFWRRAFEGWIRKTMFILITSLSLFLSLRDGVLDPQYRDRFLLKYIPQLPWYVWTIIGFVCLLLLALEGAYRVYNADQIEQRRKLREKIRQVKTEQKLNGIHANTKELLETRDAKKPETNSHEKHDVPRIIVQIKEAFVLPSGKYARCFLLVSLNNSTDVPCSIPDDYSLTLTISGNEYPAKRFLDLDEYYLSNYKVVDMIDNQGDVHEGEEETSREDLRDLRTATGELKRGIPVKGWLGFFAIRLPEWPYDEEIIGYQMEYDKETGEAIEVPVIEKAISIHTLDSLSLRVIDAYNESHAAKFTGPFSRYGRRIVKRPLDEESLPLEEHDNSNPELATIKAEYDNRIKELEEEKATLEASNKELGPAMHAYLNKTERLQRDLENLHAGNSFLVQERDAIKSELEIIKNTYDKRIKELEGEKTALESSAEKDSKTIEQYKKQIERSAEQAENISVVLSSQRAELENLKAQYGFLHEMAEKHAEDISKCVQVRDYFSCYEKSLDPPQIIMGFDLYNKSVFDIVISPEVKGDIRLDSGVFLRSTITILERSEPKPIQPSSNGSLYIEVRVTADMLNIITGRENDKDGAFFDFNKLDITIKIASPFYKDKHARLELPQALSSKDRRNRAVIELKEFQKHADNIRELAIAYGMVNQLQEMLNRQSARAFPVNELEHLEPVLGFYLEKYFEDQGRVRDFFAEIPKIPDSRDEQYEWLSFYSAKLRALLDEKR